jgi:type I restriction enzyme S subunit
MVREEWKEVSLGEVITLQRGHDLPHKKRQPGTVPIVSSSGIIDTHSESRATGPGVITGRYGTIGEVFFIQEDFWPLNTTLYVKNFKGNDPLFISYLLRTIDYHTYSGKSGVPGVNRNDLHEITVKRPPLPEQRSIAATLSDVDALISGLDQLIAKKRDLKQAAMQQLLTGKQRLPGFSGEWEVKRLGDVIEIKKGQLITENDAIKGNVPVIAGGKKPSYFHNRPNRIGKTITISGSGANAGYVAFFNTPIFASDCSTISEGASYSIEFIYFVLHLRQEEIYKAQTGGAQPHIHPSDLMPLIVNIPDASEQRTIATVLADMDAELAALEQRRDKTRDLKQGMMQELLTGRIRLV